MERKGVRVHGQHQKQVCVWSFVPSPPFPLPSLPSQALTSFNHWRRPPETEMMGSPISSRTFTYWRCSTFPDRLGRKTRTQTHGSRCGPARPHILHLFPFPLSAFIHIFLVLFKSSICITICMYLHDRKNFSLKNFSIFVVVYVFFFFVVFYFFSVFIWVFSLLDGPNATATVGHHHRSLSHTPPYSFIRYMKDILCCCIWQYMNVSRSYKVERAIGVLVVV